MRYLFKMHFANALTVFRMAAAIVIFLLLHADRYYPALAMPVTLIVLYTLACGTDLLDGLWARSRFGRVTKFGEFFDPAADKLLVLGTILGLFLSPDDFVYWGTTIALYFIFGREVLVGAVSAFATEKEVKMETPKGGKVKTVLQMGALWLLMFGDSLQVWGEYMAWGASFLTVITGVICVRKVYFDLQRVASVPDRGGLAHP